MTPPLSYPFLRYIESTRHLVLYRLNSTFPTPPMLHLPAVDTLCLLDCAPDAIGNIVYHPFFPNLRRIHYLSAAPTDPLVHRRFPSVKWIFPWRGGKGYPFYDAMVEAGKGSMEVGLIQQYVHRWSKGGSGYKSVWMDIYLPGRGIVSGKEYADQQMAYLHKKYCDGYCVPYPICTEDNTLPPFPPSGERPHVVQGGVRVEVGEEAEAMFDRSILRLD